MSPTRVAAPCRFEDTAMQMIGPIGDMFCFLHTARAMGATISTVATLSINADTTPANTDIATTAARTFLNLDNITSAMRIGILDSMKRDTMPIVPAIIISTLKSIAPIKVEKVKSTDLSMASHTENTTAEARAIYGLNLGSANSNT